MQIYWKSAGIAPIVVFAVIGFLGLVLLCVSMIYFRSKYMERRSKSFRKSMRKASRASMRMASTNNMGSVYSQRAPSQSGMHSMAMSQRAMSQMGNSQMGMSQMGMPTVPSFVMPGAPMMDYNDMMNPQMSQYQQDGNFMYNEIDDGRGNVTIVNPNNSSMAQVHQFNPNLAQ